MADTSLASVFDDPVRSRNLALGLGALGGPLVAIGITFEIVVLLILGAIALAASGATWTMRGIREDRDAKE